jgi:hypothetical protein
MASKITLKLPHAPDNPRNSEGDFATLADGRIMFAYTRYYGDSWADNATAEIRARFSADNGRSWGDEDVLIVANEGDMNVMSVSLLRLQDGRLALFYLQKNSAADCRPRMRVSTDEGMTWSAPTLCITAPGYFVVNNDRIVQLASGRLLVPASQHRTRVDANGRASTDGRGLIMYYRSDDGGTTWAESADWWVYPGRISSGLQEPGVIELRGGQLYGWARTGDGWQWETRSRDRGETWSPPVRSRFRSPCSPLSLKRVPATGDLLAVWNDQSPRWRQGRAPARSSWGRTPLVSAISSDEGKRWRHAQMLERDRQRGFCYVAIHFVEDAALLAYCCGGRQGTGVLQDLCIRRISLNTLYGRP